MQQYDIVLIGTGQATGSLVPALLERGNRIAIIEGDRVGGSCVNYGCTPTKTLVASARAAHMAKRGPEFGIDTGAPVTRYETVAERINAMRMPATEGFQKWLEEVTDFYPGWASFVDEHTVAVGEHRLKGDTILVPAGTYEENVTVDKDGISLVAVSGSDVTTIKADGSGTEGVVGITADNITFDGFTVDAMNTELASNDRAVRVNGNYSGALIRDNVFVNSFRGIQGDSSGGMNDLEIIGNTFETAHGIASTEDMDGLVIKDNTFRTTTEGIGLGINITSSGMVIEGNYFYNTVGEDGWYIADYGDNTKSEVEALIGPNDFEASVEYKHGVSDGERAIVNQ